MTAYFPPDVGSAPHLFFELGEAFTARGHTVQVVTGFPGYHPKGDLSRYRGRSWMREEMNGMRVVRVRVPALARDTPIGRGLWQFGCSAAFAAAGARLERPDVCLVYSPPLPLGLAALALRAWRKVPVVFNVQDLFPQSAIDLGLLRNPLLIRTFNRMEALIYRRVDGITVHSEGNRTYVLSRGARAETTDVVHNAIDIAHVRPGPRMNDLRKETGLGDLFVASFGGIMGHSQDLDVILDAAQVLRDRSDIHFVLAGEGVEKERCEKKGREMGLGNVTWLPMLPRERYPLLLQASDVCLTTLKGAVKTPVVPSKILSAMAAGRPVIAALDERGDAPALIAQADAGFSVPPENAAALADRILHLATQPDLARRLGENGRRFAEEFLSHESVAAQYEGLFEKVIGLREKKGLPRENGATRRKSYGRRES